MMKYFRVIYFIETHMITKYTAAETYDEAEAFAQAATDGILPYTLEEISFPEYYRSCN